MTNSEYIAEHPASHIVQSPKFFRGAILLLLSFLLGFAVSEINGKSQPLATSLFQYEAPTGIEDWHGNVMRSTPLR